jgi:hypothetical protein
MHTKTYLMQSGQTLADKDMFTFLKSCDERNFLMAASLHDG